MAEREPGSIKIGILTLSDSCFSGAAIDRSGENLKQLIESGKHINGTVVTKDILPDDFEQIKAKLLHWSDHLKLDLILTTGGTGFSLRDVTPEATKAVLDKEALGMALAMLKGSLEITPLAMLTRLACGTRGKTLIINLPGSVKGSTECFSIASTAIPHAVDLLRGHKASVEKTHFVVQSEGVKAAHSSRHQLHLPYIQAQLAEPVSSCGNLPVVPAVTVISGRSVVASPQLMLNSDVPQPSKKTDKSRTATVASGKKPAKNFTSEFPLSLPTTMAPSTVHFWRTFLSLSEAARVNLITSILPVSTTSFTVTSPVVASPSVSSVRYRPTSQTIDREPQSNSTSLAGKISLCDNASLHDYSSMYSLPSLTSNSGVQPKFADSVLPQILQAPTSLSALTTLSGGQYVSPVQVSSTTFSQTASSLDPGAQMQSVNAFCIHSKTRPAVESCSYYSSEVNLPAVKMADKPYTCTWTPNYVDSIKSIITSPRAAVTTTSSSKLETVCNDKISDKFQTTFINKGSIFPSSMESASKHLSSSTQGSSESKDTFNFSHSHVIINNPADSTHISPANRTELLSNSVAGNHDTTLCTKKIKPAQDRAAKPVVQIFLPCSHLHTGAQAIWSKPTSSFTNLKKSSLKNIFKKNRTRILNILKRHNLIKGNRKAAVDNVDVSPDSRAGHTVSQSNADEHMDTSIEVDVENEAMITENHNYSHIFSELGTNFQAINKKEETRTTDEDGQVYSDDDVCLLKSSQQNLNNESDLSLTFKTQNNVNCSVGNFGLSCKDNINYSVGNCGLSCKDNVNYSVGNCGLSCKDNVNYSVGNCELSCKDNVNYSVGNCELSCKDNVNYSVGNCELSCKDNVNYSVGNCELSCKDNVNYSVGNCELFCKDNVNLQLFKDSEYQQDGDIALNMSGISFPHGSENSSSSLSKLLSSASQQHESNQSTRCMASISPASHRCENNQYILCTPSTPPASHRCENNQSTLYATSSSPASQKYDNSQFTLCKLLASPASQRCENSTCISENKSSSSSLVKWSTTPASSMMAIKAAKIHNVKQQGELLYVSVGKSFKSFIREHPLVQGIYLHKGKREIKKQLAQLCRQCDVSDRMTSWRRGKEILERNCFDDYFELTDDGRREQKEVHSSKKRDQYVVNWYVWCPGHGNCKRKCGGYGACVDGCQGMQHKQDRHNCSLMINMKLFLSDLSTWRVNITGTHVPLGSGMQWNPPALRCKHNNPGVNDDNSFIKITRCRKSCSPESEAVVDAAYPDGLNVIATRSSPNHDVWAFTEASSEAIVESRICDNSIKFDSDLKNAAFETSTAIPTKKRISKMISSLKRQREERLSNYKSSSVTSKHTFPIGSSVKERHTAPEYDINWNNDNHKPHTSNASDGTMLENSDDFNYGRIGILGKATSVSDRSVQQQTSNRNKSSSATAQGHQLSSELLHFLTSGISQASTTHSPVVSSIYSSNLTNQNWTLPSGYLKHMDNSSLAAEPISAFDISAVLGISEGKDVNISSLFKTPLTSNTVNHSHQSITDYEQSDNLSSQLDGNSCLQEDLSRVGCSLKLKEVLKSLETVPSLNGSEGFEQPFLNSNTLGEILQQANCDCHHFGGEGESSAMDITTDQPSLFSTDSLNYSVDNLNCSAGSSQKGQSSALCQKSSNFELISAMQHLLSAKGIPLENGSSDLQQFTSVKIPQFLEPGTTDLTLDSLPGLHVFLSLPETCKPDSLLYSIDNATTGSHSSYTSTSHMSSLPAVPHSFPHIVPSNSVTDDIDSYYENITEQLQEVEHAEPLPSYQEATVALAEQFGLNQSTKHL